MISDITRHVVFFIYPQFTLIDLSGPLEAFGLATMMIPGSYRVSVMSPVGGEVERCEPPGQCVVEVVDETCLVAGPENRVGKTCSGEGVA